MSWWLARRSLGDDRAGLAVVAAAAVVVGVIAAALSAVPGVLAAQDRSRAVLTASDSSDETGLRASYRRWAWRDRYSINVVLVGVDGDPAPLPAGLSRLPAPGEVMASPQVLRDARTDPQLAVVLGDRPQRLPALVVPNSRSRMLLIGVDAQSLAQSGRPPTAVWGGTADFRLRDPVEVPGAVALAVALVLLPSLWLLAAAQGAYASRRQRRAALLVAVGVHHRRAARLATMPARVAAVVGVLLAQPLALALSHLVTHVPGTAASWWPGQVQVTWWGLLGSLAIALVVGRRRSSRALASGADDLWRDPDAQEDAAAVAPSRGTGGTVPRAVALMVLAGCTWTALAASGQVRADDSRYVPAVLAVLLAVGAATSASVTALLATAAGRALVRLRSKPAHLVAGARLRAGTGLSSAPRRLMAGTLILLMAVAPVVAQVAPRDTAAQVANERAGRVLVTVLEVTDPGVAARVLSRPEVLVAAVPEYGDDGRVAYRLSCDGFRLVAGASGLEDCSTGAPATADPSTGALAASLDGSGRWVFVGEPTLPASTWQAPPDTGEQAPLIVAVEDAASAQSLAAALARTDPVLDVSARTGGLIGGLDQGYARLQSWLIAGMLWLVLTMIAGLAVHTFAETRRAALAEDGPRRLGVSDAFLTRAKALELGVAAASFVVVVGSGLFIVRDAATGWVRSDPLPPGWAGALLGLLLLAATTDVLAPLLARRLRPTPEATAQS